MICSSWLLFVYMKDINFCKLVLYPSSWLNSLLFLLVLVLIFLMFFQDAMSLSTKKSSVSTPFSISVLPVAYKLYTCFYVISFSRWGTACWSAGLLQSFLLLLWHPACFIHWLTLLAWLLIALIFMTLVNIQPPWHELSSCCCPQVIMTHLFHPRQE